MKKITVEDFEERLFDRMSTWRAVNSVETFAQSDVLTIDKGVKVELNNGQEFLLTIQEWKR